MSADVDAMYSDDDVEFAIWQEPRKEPLGAPKEFLEENLTDQVAGDRLHALEEEQEILSSSVFSLTSHLAQVEFRLRQILKAPPEEKDAMLKALEEFTSRGVSDTRTEPQGSSGEATCGECVALEHKIRKQRAKQEHFVEKLKTQLKDLQKFASESSETGSTHHMSLIEHLRTEIDRGLEEGCQHPLSVEDLRHQINCAVRQYADRQLSKDEIISKLQAHVEDMQKFIKLMKNEELKNDINKTKAPEPKKPTKTQNSFDKSFSKNKVNDDLKAETINLMRKASTLIQIFTVSQFGCSPDASRRYDKQSSSIVTHWGNLRAKLEMSIDAVLNLVSREKSPQSVLDSYESESEEGIGDSPLTIAVRRHLAVNLKDLLQHGLTGPESSSLVPIMGCFPIRRSSASHFTHIWELILRYYDLNDGDRFNSTPARKLSQSFNLDMVGGTAITNKQSLLSAIGSILASHMPYKRSYDAQFKAFVCSGLNSHKLVIWLNIILKCRFLIDSYYSSTSYVVNTGFTDALQSLDRLTKYNFDLPVDLAVKQFQNIKDIFN